MLPFARQAGVALILTAAFFALPSLQAQPSEGSAAVAGSVAAASDAPSAPEHSRDVARPLGPGRGAEEAEADQAPDVVGPEIDKEDESRLTVEALIGGALKALRAAEKRDADLIEHLKEVVRLQKLIEARLPESLYGKFIRARLDILVGRSRQAIGPLNEYIASSLGRADWEAYKILGDVFLDAGYYRQAEQKLLQAAGRNPREASIYTSLANCALKNAETKKAVAYAQRADELAQNGSAKAKEALARALKKAERTTEALPELERALELVRQEVRDKPADVTVLNRLKQLYKLHGELLGSLINAEPRNPEWYQTLADLIQDQSELENLLSYHRALSVVNAGIERTAPNSPAALRMEAARLRYAVGDVAEAVEELETVLEAEPDHAQARAWLTRLQAELAAAPSAQDGDQ